MKTIATFTKPEQAHLLRVRLGAVGIPAYLLDENVIQTDLLYSNALGGVRVQVADGDLEAARELLQQDSQPGTGAGAQYDGDGIECCACHALIPEGQTRCVACGWSYEDSYEPHDTQR
jgi:hypothetical protein